MLFGANSTVGTAILVGLLRKYDDLVQTRFNRNEIEFGLSSLTSARERRLIVVISIGVLESDYDGGNRGTLRQFNVNTALSARILEVALSNPLVCEIHVASSIAALAPRPGFLGYHISKRSLDEVAIVAAINSQLDVSIFIWRLPFIPSLLNRGRKPPALFHATVEQVSDCVASSSKPGIMYVKASHRILAKPVFIYGLLCQALRASRPISRRGAGQRPSEGPEDCN
jgi:hypothetical protein